MGERNQREDDEIKLSMQKALSSDVDRLFLYPESQAVPRPFTLLDLRASESKPSVQVLGQNSGSSWGFLGFNSST